ncbi:MAG: GFA family protein [Pseudomonadota bacterium]
MLSGGCECGQVRFEVYGEIEDFSHCHCSQCRRLHGAAFATFAGVRRNRFRYTRGEDAAARYASSERNVRVFCAKCGSTILVVPREEPDMLYLSMSAVEGNPERPEGYHAWVGSRAPWHEISDGLPQFEAEPNDD